MTTSQKSVLILLILSVFQNSYQDVSHFFAQAPEFGYYQHQHHQHHLQQQHSHIPVAFQQGISSLYAAPPTEGLYSSPIVGSEIVTPAPVAPVVTSTEFVAPEIIENRSVKDHRNFIPLLKQQYLPPAPPMMDERPNYESPQQR